MRQISSTIYASLSPRQRVIACIEASARGDECERQRLVRSCPKFNYVQTDLCFSGSMDRLMGLAMAIEADLKEFVLRFLYFESVDLDDSSKFLEDFSNIREAWRMTLATVGIDSRSMALAGPPASPVFDLIGGLVPKPDKSVAEVYSAEMLDFLAV